MGFGGKSGCVQGENILCSHVFCTAVVAWEGEVCPEHATDEGMKREAGRQQELARQETEREKPARTCNFIGCYVKLPRDAAEGAYCSPKCENEAKGPAPYEFVNHPKHYNEHPAGIECIDVIEYMTLNVGTAVKYLWRAGLKPGEADVRDLDKALWYINREKERLAKVKK